MTTTHPPSGNFRRILRLHRAAVATAQELFATAPDMIQGAAGTFFMELMMLHVGRRAAARRAYAVFQTRVVYRGNCRRWRKLSVFKRERGVMDMDHRQYRRWRRKSAYFDRLAVEYLEQAYREK